MLFDLPGLFLAVGKLFPVCRFWFILHLVLFGKGLTLWLKNNRRSILFTLTWNTFLFWFFLVLYSFFISIVLGRNQVLFLLRGCGQCCIVGQSVLVIGGQPKSWRRSSTKVRAWCALIFDYMFIWLLEAKTIYTSLPDRIPLWTV